MKNKQKNITSFWNSISHILEMFYDCPSNYSLEFKPVRKIVKEVKWILEDKIESSLKEEKKIKKIRSRNIGQTIREAFQKQQKVGAQIDENDLSQFVSFDEMEISLSFNELFYLINDACSTNEKTKKHFFPLNVRVWF